MEYFCQIDSVMTPVADLIPRLAARMPGDDIRRVVIKPNWVSHERDPDFPVSALVTATALIDATIQACLAKYRTLESILIADIPIQGCDWELLSRQAGIADLAAKYSDRRGVHVAVRDLRMQRVTSVDGYLRTMSPTCDHGDPQGYSDVVLDDGSFLEPVSGDRTRFRVADYSPEETESSHRRGYHRYRIARSLLDCDLFINMPKLKTHQKAGITGALKNVVGINGSKSYLVHYRAGRAPDEGDEYPPGVPFLVWMQSRVRRRAQQGPEVLFRALQKCWRGLRRGTGWEVKLTHQTKGRRFLVTPGGWYGNDSIWRMVYDLNRIVLYARPEGGGLATSPQRRYLAILDGITAGEGNGPLQPIPVAMGILGISDNPFILDLAAARMMGFDYRKIPLLARHREFGRSSWGDFDPATVPILKDGQLVLGLESLPIVHPFLPPPGWAGNIEMDYRLARKRKIASSGTGGRRTA